MKKGRRKFKLYEMDFYLITLRQAERDLCEFQWRYRELEDECHLVEEARKKIAARRSEIEYLRGNADPTGRGMA